MFSPYSSIKRLIDLKYAYCYRDTEGFCVSVDGLYNMTDAINYNILESIPLKNRSAVSNGEMNTTSLQNSKGTSKKELGSHAAHINIKKLSSAYKVSFRYLRGAYTPFDATKGVGIPSGPSSPSGDKPGGSVPGAGPGSVCSTPQRATPDHNQSQNQSPVTTTPPATPPVSSVPAVPQTPLNQRTSPALQRTSPAASRSTSPATAMHMNTNMTGTSVPGTGPGYTVIHHPDDIIDDVSSVLDFHTSREAFPLYYDSPKIVTDMQVGADACVLILVTLIKLQVSEKGKIFVSMQYGSDSPTACNYYGLCPVHTLESSPFYMGSNIPSGFLEEKSDFDYCYVNTGTFQVPLFMGVVPSAVLESDTPYKKLCSMLRKQNNKDAKCHALAVEQNKSKSKSWLGGFFNRNKTKTSNSVVPDTTGGMELETREETEEENLNFNQEKSEEDPMKLRLTSGASVLLRMSDARLYSFNNSHIGHDYTITPDTTFINDILNYYSTSYSTYSSGGSGMLGLGSGSASKRKKIHAELKKLFQYESMKFDDEENLKKNLPATVVSGRSLWRKATDIYTKNVLEFHENN